MFVLAITAASFSLPGSVLAYVLIRYRQRATDSDREPAQIYGSNQIELSWTVIPMLIVVVLFLTTARVIFNTEYASKPDGALDVVVIGHQFWWEFRYPKLGIVTANELHIPSAIRGPTPTYLEMSSADTDHSFWVPQLAGKTDVIPNRVNVMWIDPEAPGSTWDSARNTAGCSTPKCCCACMGSRRAILTRGSRNSSSRRSRMRPREEGESVFLRNACINCHTIAGTVATGRFGPDLTHLASRDTIASGAVPNTPENLRSGSTTPLR
jgi:cytochrome c oxidase subunit 2